MSDFLDLKLSMEEAFGERERERERERVQPHGRDVGSIRRVQTHTLGCDLKETANLHY